MHIRLLGGFAVTTAVGNSVRLATRKTRFVAAALAISGTRGVTRTQLCRLFWPDRAAPQARSSLRQALTDIRRALGEDADQAKTVEGDQETVRLGLPESAVDALAFEAGAKRLDAEALRAAAELYRGDLLAGIDLPDDADDLAERMSAFPAAAPELLDTCEALAERLLAQDCAAEEAHRALIRVHQRRGRLSAALRQFEECRAVLRKELGAAPDRETAALVAALRDPMEGAPQADADPPIAPAPARVSIRDRGLPSIIVVPFDNLSGPSDEYFVDGVVEEITAALSRVRDFFVIARQSAFTYKGRFVDVREVGSELGVSYVVEGTVRRGGDRLRISVQLVDAASRQQLWADRFDGTNSDVFAFQDRIAANMAGAIHPAVRRAEVEMARLKPPSDLRAYDLLMRAYPRVWAQHAESVREAIATLEQAIEIDPEYWRAHALLGWCHAMNLSYLWTSDSEVEEQVALRCVQRASPSIGDDPTALTACGATLHLLGKQAESAALLRTALQLDPNNALAWTRLGWVGVFQGEPSAAMECFEKAMALSPLDPFMFSMRMGLGSALALAGHLEEALAIGREVVAQHPQLTWAYRFLTAWAGMAGDLTTARWAADRLLALQPDYTVAKYLAVPVMRSNPKLRDWLAGGMRLGGLPEG
jgi:TolB-like protein/DNA-binding SARP family transcriptional activator